MTAQLDFFSAPAEPPMLPFQRASRTSRAAAVEAQPNAELQRARVLDFIRRQRDGATRQEASLALGIPIQSICPRFDDLKKAGAIRDTGRTRKTTTGRAAEVWEAVKNSPKGITEEAP